jgi:tRNA-2-methylthio-N6-dimethylallyladenosine synthase
MEGISFCIETIGCQMNEQDSLRICQQMFAVGCRQVLSAEEADILILNTCCIRQKAEEKAYSMLGRYRDWKRQKEGRVLVVCGCVAQKDGIRLPRRVPHVDLVVGPHHVSKIAQYVQRHRETGAQRVAVSLLEGTVDDLDCTGVSCVDGVRAYVTIMEGCNNYCAYCIVPYVRGRERSRPVHSLWREVGCLVGKGIQEITLLGQNVNAYRAPDRPDFGFSAFLRGLGSMRGLKRVRFTTSHPKDLSQDIIDCFGELEFLCEHIHLPVQSGSDGVLANMKRKYTADNYREKVFALRDRCPQMAITTDIIVGFPDETEKDFQRTLSLVEELRFDNIFSFKYSSRAGTRAADFPDSVPEEVKRQRLDLLQAKQRKISLRKNRELEGHILEVLVEGGSRDRMNRMGRTRTNKVVNFTGEQVRKGFLVDVKIEKGSQNSLQGSLFQCARDAERMCEPGMLA